MCDLRRAFLLRFVTDVAVSIELSDVLNRLAPRDILLRAAKAVGQVRLDRLVDLTRISLSGSWVGSKNPRA